MKILICLLGHLMMVWGNPPESTPSLIVTEGQMQPIPIAVMAFEGDGPGKDALSSVVEHDLRYSGFFDVIDSKAHVQNTLAREETPRFDDWKLIQSRLLVTGWVETVGDKQRVHFKLWDIYSGHMIEEATLMTEVRRRRRVGHLIANMIYKRMTGEDGYFDTRIVYISEKGPQEKRVKCLAVMDVDGENHQILSSGRLSVVTPRFSPNCQSITYMSFDGKIQQGKVHVHDLERGQTRLVGAFQGITYAPRFSPDGKQVIMSQALNGKSSIYTLDLSTGTKKQLTDSLGIDTSPCYAPDGRFIVFNSDRGGKKQLYVMDADGSNIRRISYGGGSYATPVWSPDGEWIAFTKGEGGQFYIGVMKPDGSEERLLTQGFLVEGPSWAPNSRVIVFYGQEPWGKDGKGGKASLYTIHVSGHNKQKLKTPEDGTDPAWSPSL